jgi:hypothetical protein
MFLLVLILVNLVVNLPPSCDDNDDCDDYCDDAVYKDEYCYDAYCRNGYCAEQIPHKWISGINTDEDVFGYWAIADGTKRSYLRLAPSSYMCWERNGCRDNFKHNHIQVDAFLQDGENVAWFVAENGNAYGTIYGETVADLYLIPKAGGANPGTIVRVSITDEREGWALNSNGYIYSFSTDTWYNKNVYKPGWPLVYRKWNDITRCKKSGEGCVWGVEDSGDVYRYAGGASNYYKVDGISGAKQVAAWDYNNAYVVKNNGNVKKYSSGSWSGISNPDVDMIQIAIADSNKLWGVCEDNLEWFYDGSSWDDLFYCDT